jgi:SAM-dependent methyltransferase
MPSVEHHYATHLAPIYEWMAGGAERALELGESDLAAIRGAPGLALDLGAGFGMHAVPLAKAGFRVLAVDSSALLLDRLRVLAAGLAIETFPADLLDFPTLIPPGQKPDLILCMGDTLTHLPDTDSVAQLATRVANALSKRGRFIATFRDYSTLPEGERRFIAVRADDSRILTCFLEEHPQHVQVHDLLHELSADGWRMKVSSYQKLCLRPDDVRALFQSAGLQATISPGPRGMVQLIATAI